MRSADPIQASGSPPFSNQKIRLCSRNRPSTERTSMVSASPGTPGRSAQMPRVSSWTGTPAREARYSASITASSTTELALMPDARRAALLVVLDLALDPLDEPVAHGVRRDQQAARTTGCRA